MTRHRFPFLLLATAFALARRYPPRPSRRRRRCGRLFPRTPRPRARLVQGYVDDGKCAGAITLIARDGRIVDVHAVGYRDVAAKQPMERDTLCYIYSLTKVAIAVTTLTLWEEGGSISMTRWPRICPSSRT